MNDVSPASQISITMLHPQISALNWGSMAAEPYLGTERHRTHCFFYLKTGACQFGHRCTHLHNRPTISPTLLLSHMYQRPAHVDDPRKIQDHFEDFYEDIFEELSVFGEIECLNVCDNFADHLIGNVYVMFREESQAAAALQAFQRRSYCGLKIIADFSPVTDFYGALCRQNKCHRGGNCNFMHLKQIGRGLSKKLFGRRRRTQIHSDGLPGDWRQSADRYVDNNVRWKRQRHDTSPVREGSEERRAKIEQWNREREGRW